MKQSPAEPLEQYARLVERYHETLDLVSDNALENLDQLIGEAVRYAELIASLSPAPRSILDLGSGVGLPGVPIAVELPGVSVTLVERRRRRATFLRIAVSQLGLENATVVQGDARSLTSPCCDAVTAQAVGRLDEIYRLSRHLQGEWIWLVTRKGPGWRDELSELEAQLGSRAIELHEERLAAHGSVVAVLLPGGSVCPPSGSSTRKGASERPPQR